QFHALAQHGPRPERLDTRHLHQLQWTGREASLDDAVGDAGAIELAAGLADDLAAMGQSEYRPIIAARLLPNNLSAEDGFTGAGRCHQHNATRTGCDTRAKFLDHVGLVAAELGAHPSLPGRERGYCSPARLPLAIVSSTDGMPSSVINPLTSHARIRRSLTVPPSSSPPATS